MELEEAIRNAIATHVETLVQNALQAAKEKASGGLFKYPTGETANSLSAEQVGDLSWTITATSKGAFYTNLGAVLTPNQSNALGLLKWQGSDGRWYSKAQVDMSPYKDWLRKCVVEAVSG